MTKMDEVMKVESSSDTRDNSEIEIERRAHRESFQDVWIGNQVKLKA